MIDIDKTINDFESFIDDNPRRCGFALVCEDLCKEKSVSSFVATNGDVEPSRQVAMYSSNLVRLMKESGDYGVEFVQTLFLSAECALYLYNEKSTYGTNNDRHQR